ncbi:MAG: hypothetical protein JSR80_07130 [Verrucomicrobia bacterium]|nr:hypothetical protein [Verrucomicrobiota bacterium]
MKNFIEIIEGIADEEYQKRIWIRGEGPECDDFTETVCHFFDDGDPILKKYRDFGITENQYIVLKKFRKAFEAFHHENYWEPDSIDSPEWTRITEMAKEVLISLKGGDLKQPSPPLKNDLDRKC